MQWHTVVLILLIRMPFAEFSSGVTLISRTYGPNCPLAAFSKHGLAHPN